MGRVLDNLREQTYKFLLENSFHGQDVQLHIHPHDCMLINREWSSEIASPEPFIQNETKEVFMEGLRMELVVNSFCRRDDPVITYRVQKMNVPHKTEHYWKDETFPVYELRQSVATIINYHHEIIIPIGIPNPYQAASERLYADKKSEMESNRLVANRIDHKILITEHSVIITINENDMYKYYYIDGVTKQATEKCCNFAKQKLYESINSKVNEIKRRWRIEDTARHYSETGFIPIDETSEQVRAAVDFASGSDHPVDAIVGIRNKIPTFAVIDDLEDNQNDPEKVKAYHDMITKQLKKDD